MLEKIRGWLLKLLGGVKKETKEKTNQLCKDCHIRKVEAELTEYNGVRLMSDSFIEEYFRDMFKKELKVHVKCEHDENSNKTKYKAYVYIVDKEDNIDDFVYKTSAMTRKKY